MKEKSLISLITILLFINLLSVDLYSHERFELSNSQSSQSTVRIIKKDSPLRLKPNSESLIIKKLPLGSEFPVVETIDGWIKIKLPPDKDGIEITGYINKSFVEFKIKPTEIEKDESLLKKQEPSIQESANSVSLEKSLEKAKTTSSTGSILTIAGGVIFTISIIGTFANQKEVYDFPYIRNEARWEYLAADGVGLAVLITGLAIWIPASGKVKRIKKRLKKLEEKKKIASIRPIVKPYKKEYGIQLRIVF